ncbi:MAG: thrombospondin type 3 repeat-containing protein [Oscillospiraceae bacterium]|nr:thrombospondin type 3 repeat-containing protein [Oscillospiraceae bacterium]
MKKSLIAVTAFLLTLTACGSVKEEPATEIEELSVIETELETLETTEETQEKSAEPDTSDTEKETEIQSEYILAYADVYENTITFMWATEYVLEGEMELQSSEDNVDFETIAVLQFEDGTYDYEITDNFEIRYFKIIQEQPDDTYKESFTMIVQKDEEGQYYISLPDTDGDGLNDMLEIMYETAIDNPDMDGDGLTDYEEVFLCGTDPTVYDSVTKGVPDSDADADGDGLTNAEEIAAGTNSYREDSDDDGLTDYEEVYTYKTDPREPDTDGDGLPDGVEIKVALDPLNPVTHGTPDAEYTVTMTYTADDAIFNSINKTDSPYQMSIEVEGTAMAVSTLYVSESGYSNVMQNESILGMIPEITSRDEEGITRIKIMFEIAEEYWDNTLNRYPDEPELQDLKRLNVFHFFEDGNMSLPIETKHDLEKHIVYAETDEPGTYCIVDMEMWLAQMEDIANDPRLQN